MRKTSLHCHLNSSNEMTRTVTPGTNRSSFECHLENLNRHFCQFNQWVYVNVLYATNKSIKETHDILCLIIMPRHADLFVITVFKNTINHIVIFFKLFIITIMLVFITIIITAFIAITNLSFSSRPSFIYYVNDFLRHNFPICPVIY